MSQKNKVADEIKIEIVQSYLDGDLSLSQAASQFEISKTTIRDWILRYRSEGPCGLINQKTYRNYSETIKLSAVQDYLDGKGSQSEICQQYKIKSTKRLRNWIKIYNRHEDFSEHRGKSKHMTKARSTTIEEREEIVRWCISNDLNYRAAADRFQVSYQQVYSWTKKYQNLGQPGLEDRRGHQAGTLPGRTVEEELQRKIAQLEQKVDQLTMENTLLKKVRELERGRH